MWVRLGARSGQGAALGMQGVEEGLLEPTGISIHTYYEMQPGVGRDGDRTLNLKVAPDCYEGIFVKVRGEEMLFKSLFP